jgi:hypothetical protein
MAEFEEGTAIVVQETNALAQIDRAEIDMQIATAHRFPRTVSKCLMEAKTLATMDEDTASSCGYAFTRGGKLIKGASIRCAELMYYAWGHIRVSSRVVNVTHGEIEAQGMCHDLEKNVCRGVSVRRKILDKSGNRFSEDMITVTGNAACSIAARNAIMAVIPRVFVEQVYREAMKVATGDAKSLSTKRQLCVERFARNWGINEEAICAHLGKAKIEDVDLDGVETLICVGTSLKDGDLTIDEFLASSVTAAPEEEAKPIKEKPEDRASANELLDAVCRAYKLTVQDAMAASKTLFKRQLSKLTAAEVTDLCKYIDSQHAPKAPPKPAQDVETPFDRDVETAEEISKWSEEVNEDTGEISHPTEPPIPLKTGSLKEKRIERLVELVTEKQPASSEQWDAICDGIGCGRDYNRLVVSDINKVIAELEKL